MLVKVILLVALALPPFAWLLVLQMRAISARALYIAAQDKFPDIHPNDIKAAAKAAPRSSVESQLPEAVEAVRVWMVETYPAAIERFALARRLSWIPPIVGLVVVAIWRVFFGDVFE